MLQPSSVGKELMVSTMDAGEDYGDTRATFYQVRIAPAALSVNGVLLFFFKSTLLVVPVQMMLCLVVNLRPYLLEACFRPIYHIVLQ